MDMAERTPVRHLSPGHRRAIVVGLFMLLAVVPACSSSSTPSTNATSTSTSATTSTTTAVTLPQASSASVAACESDARTLEAALDAYMAEKGSYPSPPSPWSATAYVANFGPLTSAAGGEGPYLSTPPPTTLYVNEYDSSGHVSIAPPGAYGAAYDPGQSAGAGAGASASASASACLAAVR